MKKRGIVLTVGLLVIALAVGGTLAGAYYLPNASDDNNNIEVVEIKENMTGAEIGDTLYEKGVIRSPEIFRLALRLTGTMDKLQHGYYEIPYNASMHEVIGLLQDGKVKEHKLTIPEGFTIFDIANRLEEQGLANKQEFLQEAKTFVPYMYMYGPQPVTYRVEGFLFPSTYDIPEKATPKDILAMMAKEMNNQITPEMRAEIEKQHMTIFEFITLASLVEKEAKYDEDRPIIAAVFKKRLADHMPLQSCASIDYILGYHKPILSIEDTKIESPYNTYLHTGLPPGPIANPGMKSMEAVLYAPQTDYVFFVADKEGHHHFSKTYEEHLKTVEQIYGT